MNTGIQQLDRDLEALLSLDSPEKLEEIRNLKKKDNPTIGDILSVVDPRAIRVSAGLLSDEIFSDLKNKIKSDSKDEFVKAKKFTQEHLEELINSEIIQDEFFREQEVDDFQPLSESLNIITSISGTSNWIIQKNNVIPAIRYIFSNSKRKKVLLQSTLDWEDVLFTTEGLLDLLKDDIENTSNLLDQKTLKKLNIDSDNLTDRIENISKLLNSIKKDLSNIDE